MKWQPVMWFVIAFVTFAVIGGPSFLSILQETNQQAQVIEKQEQEIAELQRDLEHSAERIDQSVSKRVAEMRAPLEDKLSQLRDELNAAQSKMERMSDHEVYRRRMQANLGDVKEHIGKLAEQAEKASGEDEIQLRQRIAELQTRHDQIEAKLDSLTETRSERWGEQQSAIDDAWSKISSLIVPRSSSVNLATTGVAN